MLFDFQVDELVGDDAHTLEGKSLHARPREALDDPALALLFVTVDLVLHQIDHDVIVNVLEVVEALLDARGMGTILADVVAEEAPRRDTLPLEVLSESVQVFGALAAGRSHEEHAPDRVHLNLLQEKGQRVLRSGNDKLLHEVLEHLVDLVLLKVRFN